MWMLLSDESVAEERASYVVKETVINPMPQIVPVMIPSPPPHPYPPHQPYKPYEIWCGGNTDAATAHFGVN
jgi:hypothetical protein